MLGHVAFWYDTHGNAKKSIIFCLTYATCEIFQLPKDGPWIFVMMYRSPVDHLAVYPWESWEIVQYSTILWMSSGGQSQVLVGHGCDICAGAAGSTPRPTPHRHCLICDHNLKTLLSPLNSQFLWQDHASKTIACSTLICDWGYSLFFLGIFLNT